MSQTPTLSAYRTTFVLDTRGYEEPVQTLIEKISDTLTGLGAEISEVRDLGTKEFARVTDRKFPQAVYVQFFVNAPADLPATVQEKFRLDRTIYRILVENV